MADLTTLGRRIRHFRAAAGLTLDQVSDATGTAPSHLSLIENGRREPRLSLLEAIAEARGVSAAALLDPSPPWRSNSSGHRRLPPTANSACRT